MVKNILPGFENQAQYPVTLGKLLNLSTPQFPFLSVTWKFHKDNIYFTGMSDRLTESVFVKLLEEHLEFSKK